MNIKAIPTVYKSVKFRSRLEARWACFFDLLGWPWAYEAVDLDGWIPDFILGKNLSAGIPCEVKPIDFMGLSSPERELLWQPHLDQLNRATNAVGPEGGFILLGSRPFWDDFWLGNHAPPLADFGVSFFPRYSKFNWTERFVADEVDGQFDFVLEQHPYRGAITGRSYNVFERDDINEFIGWDHHILPLWNLAGNTVQWKAP